MIRRINYVLNNEEGSLLLEQIVIISVLLLIASVLMILVFHFHSLSETQSGYTTSTGWFRTENTTNMKNS